MDDVGTRDKHEPHYGMSNLNSRQEEKKTRKTENILLQERKKKKQETQLERNFKIARKNSINLLNHRFDNEVEHFLVLNVHFQGEV